MQLSKRLSIVFVLLCFSQAALPQGTDPATAKKIDSLFKEWDNKTTPGCAIAVVRNDSVIYAKGFGLANLEYHVPITTQSIFEMGSVSKQFTAFAIFLLAHQGKLRLDDDIHKYLPWLPVYDKKITVAQLLYHTSGIRDYDQLLAIAGTGQEDLITREHVIKVLSKQKLNFDPGEQYLYSNSGFFLAGEIIHSVTGKTLRQFTDSAIFRPLGMNNTHFHDDYAEVVNNLAYSYQAANKICIINSSVVGAKGLFTNIDDMSKWVIAVSDSKSAFYPIMQQLIPSGKLNNGKETKVGAGIFVTDFKGFKMPFHDGVDGGYRNFIEYFPEANMAFVLFSNGSSNSIWANTTEFPSLFIRDKPQVKGATPDKSGTAVKLRGDSIVRDIASAKLLAGQYNADDEDHVEFKLKDKKLYYVSSGTNYLLLQTARDSFYFPGDPKSEKFTSSRMTFAFTRKSDGTISARQTWPQTDFGRSMVRIDAHGKLSDKQLLTYTGRYHSRELDCSYAIVLKDHQLILTNSKYNDSPITFYDKNRLFNGLNFMHTLIIDRDKKDNITGFEVNFDGIQDLRFDKVE